MLSLCALGPGEAGEYARWRRNGLRIISMCALGPGDAVEYAGWMGPKACAPYRIVHWRLARQKITQGGSPGGRFVE